MKFSWLCLCLILVSKSVGAATLSGYVTDASNGESLPFANVALKDTGLGAVSNSNGYFAINNVPEGTYSLVVSYIGYQPFELSVALTVGENRRVDAALTLQPLATEETVVEADRFKEERTAHPSFLSLQATTLSALPAVGEADFLRSL